MRLTLRTCTREDSGSPIALVNPSAPPTVLPISSPVLPGDNSPVLPGAPPAAARAMSRSRGECRAREVVEEWWVGVLAGPKAWVAREAREKGSQGSEVREANSSSTCVLVGGGCVRATITVAHRVMESAACSRSSCTFAWGFT